MINMFFFTAIIDAINQNLMYNKKRQNPKSRGLITKNINNFPVHTKRKILTKHAFKTIMTIGILLKTIIKSD